MSTRDKYGHWQVVGGDKFALSLTNGINFGSFVDNQDGTYQLNYALNRAAAYKATLIVANAIVVGRSFKIVAGSTNPFYSHVSMNWGWSAAGNPKAFNVYLRDSWGNPREKQDVPVYVTFNSSSISTPGTEWRQSGTPVVMSIPTGSLEVTWDFETGDLRGWIATGTAFTTQPTYLDNAAARRAGNVNLEGDYYIGTFEDRPEATVAACSTQGDSPVGTLTSAAFQIDGTALSFRVSGCGDSLVYVALVIGDAEVKKTSWASTGAVCSETMAVVTWDVASYSGQSARFQAAGVWAVCLVVAVTGSWTLFCSTESSP